MAVVDEALQARFEKGNEVGGMAMGLLGDFKEVTAYKEDGSLDLQKMTVLTHQYMSEGVENICEASFICQGGYCAVDILHKTDEGWAIYEVKSTSFPMFNEKPSKLEKYAPDIAYQKWVLSQCGINVTGTFLVCLNRDYVREGSLDIQQLFVVKDMQPLVENEYLKVATLVSQALKVINDETEPDIDLSRFKSMKPMAQKTTIAGQPDDENNYDAQPIQPQNETIKIKKKMTLDIAPYSFTMLQINL